MSCVEIIRGQSADPPGLGWTRDLSSQFGEDLVGGWLLQNGGLVEGLEKGRQIPIPAGGALPKRRADWLLGRRIVVEVKTYAKDTGKGDYLKNTRQVDDYCRWRDELPSERAVALARVAWRGNIKLERLFREDLRHFGIAVIYFSW